MRKGLLRRPTAPWIAPPACSSRVFGHDEVSLRLVSVIAGGISVLSGLHDPDLQHRTFCCSTLLMRSNLPAAALKIHLDSS